ncbi:virulence factor Mce family protein [Mycolicibacterium rhodesiae JS60]|nr:virulence factor Mce family protein [Mycolicibacterium rhodesiae JS60]
MLSRRVRIQLTIFSLVALIAGTVMVFGYAKAPAQWFGIGQYTVTLQLPDAGGLYERANVTYRGTQVGRVEDVRLVGNGVEATLALNSNVKIPADLKAEVHSVSAIGEQYVALLPNSGDGPALKNGDVIPVDRTSVPPDINSLLDATNRGLEAIPQDNLKTAIDEAYTAFHGLGPEISRIVKGSTALAIDSRKNLDPLIALIDQSGPVLDSQADTSQSIRQWASYLGNLSESLKDHNDEVGRTFASADAIDDARQLIERWRPTLPILAANLVSVDKVGITYQPALEQLLVILPQGIAAMQGTGVTAKNTPPQYNGLFLDFNLNINLPPPCNTGFLPTQQQRTAALVDAPDRPAGDLYCRIPQDSWLAVRGARNYPCLERPGKRAPTVAMCVSDQQYVPLNDGMNWKGDPNATLSGQGIPQQAPAPPAAPPPPPIAVANYDPATGQYVGPDGKTYTQTDLSHNTAEQTWQSMLLPPGS